MINLMKASAGTGKTYNLAKTYISLLFKKDEKGRINPYAYRHILAVTFTNKATDEMKSRILKELYILATNPEKSSYYKDFVPSVFKDASSLASNSKTILSNLLHDYGAFAISTIDRFFQQTLKAFSKEIGQMGAYQVQVKDEEIVSESVDRLLDSLSEDNPELLDWLGECVSDQLEEGNKYGLDSYLGDMGKRLRSEQRRSVMEHFGIDEEHAVSRASLRKTESVLKKTIDEFRKRVVADAKAVIDALNANGLDAGDTSRGWLKSIYGYTAGRDWDKPTDAFLKKANDFSEWYAKARQAEMQPYEQALMEPFRTFAAHFQGEEFKDYNTALILRKQLRAMGISAELFREFNGILKERNEVSLSDSNRLLKDIIDGSDAPFIYEKTGVRFDHFLLDEFQDTSRVQWDNFRPLLEESNSRQNENLIVGDVKQSIYRFRDSDWKLMAYDVPKEFPSLKEVSLEKNFRSRPNLVNFNHDLFTWLSAGLKLDNLYTGVSSQTNKSGQGLVRVMSFVNEKGADDPQIDAVADEIWRVKDQGADFGDITVLVRSNVKGRMITSSLIQKGIPVISDESLSVKSSSVVRKITAVMDRIVQPDDAFTEYVAEQFGLDGIPQDSLSLVDLVECIARDLMKNNDEAFSREASYLRAFMDCVVDYSKQNGNSVSGFLEMWKDKDLSITSPSGVNAVRVMTMHKSKGLEFPYVIVPYAEQIDLYKKTSRWCHMSGESPTFKNLDDNVYDVVLGDKVEDTYFNMDLHAEEEEQKVDNINLFYVTLTRASEGMTIMTALPKNRSDNDFGQLLVSFLEQKGADLGFEQKDGVYQMGCLDGDAFVKKDREDKVDALASEYPSFALGERLRCGASIEDFFDGEGNTGYSASERLKGIIMHDILASVIKPSDLDAAVDARVRDGLLNDDEGEEVRTLLRNCIESVLDKGWFPEDASLVSNEESIVSKDGNVCRPDRVVYDGADGVTIIDYKFGKELPSHRAQVKEYADLFREMGFKNVKTALWYVMTENIIFA